MNKYVYQIEDKKGNRKVNYSTGTMIYTRKQNALNKCRDGFEVVEYELVPTGKTFKDKINDWYYIL